MVCLVHAAMDNQVSRWGAARCPQDVYCTGVCHWLQFPSWFLGSRAPKLQALFRASQALARQWSCATQPPWRHMVNLFVPRCAYLPINASCGGEKKINRSAGFVGRRFLSWLRLGPRTQARQGLEQDRDVWQALTYGGVVGGLGQNQDLGFSGYIDPTNSKRTPHPRIPNPNPQ